MQDILKLTNIELMYHRTPTYASRLGFFSGEAMSPYLLRLFSQNVKIATQHSTIIGAIIKTNIKYIITPPSVESIAGSKTTSIV